MLLKALRVEQRDWILCHEQVSRNQVTKDPPQCGRRMRRFLTRKHLQERPRRRRMFSRTEPVMPNVYCYATRVQLPFSVFIFGIDLFSSQQAWIICISILRGFCIFRLLHFIALFQLHLKLVPEWQWWNVFRGGCEDRLRKCSYLSYTLPNEGFICWCQSLCSRFLIFGDVS
jgi:hypothetical protein